MLACLPLLAVACFTRPPGSLLGMLPAHLLHEASLISSTRGQPLLLSLGSTGQQHLENPYCSQSGFLAVALTATFVPSVTYGPSQTRAATGKYHRLGGLNNRGLFLIVLKARKSKIQGLFCGKGSVLGCGWSPSPCVLTGPVLESGRRRKREEKEEGGGRREGEGRQALTSLPLCMKTIIPL